MDHNTLDEQREVILQILRTRSEAWGGGSAGVVFTPPAKSKRGGDMPLTGAAIRHRFGVPADPSDPDSPLVETREGWSRRLVETAIDALAKYDPLAHTAINEIFNADTGGYRDLEHYEAKARESGSKVALHAHRGIWLLVAKLPPSKYPLHVRFPESAKPPDRRRKAAEYAPAYARYQELEREGMRPGAIKAALADEYGCSERRIEQIVETMREREGEEKRSRGRPKRRRK
jgi:hypothetical protein